MITRPAFAVRTFRAYESSLLSGMKVYLTKESAEPGRTHLLGHRLRMAAAAAAAILQTTWIFVEVAWSHQIGPLSSS